MFYSAYFSLRVQPILKRFAVKDNSEAEGQSNYSASQKAALAELTYMLNTMDSAALKTRGYSNARTIKNIDVVRSSISGTRSNGIDTLLFLVNFEVKKDMLYWGQMTILAML